MEHPSIGEIPIPSGIRQNIDQLHEDFFDRVPNYDRRIWSPEEAFKLKTGSCMAELLYVVGGLLHDSKVREEDVSVRFSREHGKQEVGDMMGGKKVDFKHVVLMLNIAGKQYECDFRPNRADEQPRFEAVPSDDEIYTNSDIEFFTLAEGVRQYAVRAGVPEEQVPTVAELVSLHEPGSHGPGYDEVRFDQDF